MRPRNTAAGAGSRDGGAGYRTVTNLELLTVLAAVVLLDLAVLRWGVDSRDGRNWQLRPEYAGILRTQERPDATFAL